jgi:TrmH family RNA methyltransferase
MPDDSPTSAASPGSVLDNVCVVLYESQDPINIGLVVRAMKNMGVSQLRLVRPCDYDPNRIEQVAHQTRDVVARIRHFDTLDGALADCVRVVAFDGRARKARLEVTRPRPMAEELVDWAEQGMVALMFGREDHGLPNEAIDAAHVVAQIPTTQHFSLNVAQAVLIGLYELHVAAGERTRRIKPPRRKSPVPTAEALELTFADVTRALQAIRFFRTRNPEHVMRAMRSIVARARVDSRELYLVRAMFIEVLRTIDRIRRGIEPLPDPDEPPLEIELPPEPESE